MKEAYSEMDNGLFILRLNTLIKESGLRTKEIAKLLGIDYVTLCAYRRGDSYPRLAICWQMCKLFGCSLDWLVGLTDIRKDYK